MSVNVGVQPSGIQISLPPKTHRQPVLPSSHFFLNSTSNALPPAPLPSSSSVSQQTSCPNLVPESPQTSLTDRQREICVVEGCTELIATNMWINHLNLHAQGLLSGTIPDAWLLEHGRVICPHCSHLVARSHIISHSTKCNQSTIPFSTGRTCHSKLMRCKEINCFWLRYKAETFANQMPQCLSHSNWSNIWRWILSVFD